MLFSERKRMLEIINKESRGESLWTNEIPDQLRYKFLKFVVALAKENLPRTYNGPEEDLDKTVRTIISMEQGNEIPKLSSYVRGCSDEEFPDILEATLVAFARLARGNQDTIKDNYLKYVNRLLESYRISYLIEGDEVVEFSSKELHISIVAPTLKLLASEKRFNLVEKSYRDSIKELTNGKPSDSITDAGTALQEILRVLGCKGDNFSALLKSAKSTILNGYNSRYIDAIDNLVNWVSAVRSELGDSHKVTEADKDDAWFVVHTVGILILRLSKK